jgi:hypothetical protein
MEAFLHILLVFVVAYWIPGWLVLWLTKTSPAYQTLLAVPLGIALWGWQAWIFGWLHLPWGAYGYLGLCIAAFIGVTMKHPNIIKEIWKSIASIGKDKPTLILLIIGVISQSMVLWNVLQPSGNTLVSCCGDPNDNIWYASITKSILESFPPHYPGITGQTLHNYHYWSNLVIADLVRVFHVDQILLQFRYSGVLLSLSLGLSLIALSWRFTTKQVFTRWLLFFFYFGGDMIYLISIIQQRILSFPGSSLEDGIRFLSNPPRSYAVVIVLVWLTLYSLWREKLDIRKIALLAILLSATVGLKVYLAFFLLTGLGALTLYDLVKRKQDTLVLLFVSLLFSALVYLPVNSEAGGLYFVKFWRFENFVSQPGFSLVHLDMARMIFEQDNKHFKALLFDLLFMAIYMVCIFGTKLIGLVPVRGTSIRFPLYFNILLITSLAVHFIIGSFFQQSTGGSNTFNFHVNVFLFLSFYAALALTQLHELLGKRKLAYAVITCFVIVLTLPRAAYEIREHMYRIKNLYPIIEPDTLKVIDYLRKTPENTLIANASRYISPDYNGPYLYLLTGRQQYLSSPGLLRQFGARTLDREQTMTTITQPGSPRVIKKLLELTGIDYLILDTGAAIQATKSAYWLVPEIKTEHVTLMKIDLERLPPPLLNK